MLQQSIIQTPEQSDQPHHMMARGFMGSSKNKHFIRNEKLNLILSMDSRIAFNNRSP
jgi:predicted N-acyltransferase